MLKTNAVAILRATLGAARGSRKCLIISNAVSSDRDLNLKTMRKKRKFYSGVPNHIYQRAQNGFNLFYCDEDRLVFYTIFAVCARKAPDIKVLGLCLMYDHFHSLIVSEKIEAISAFMDHCTSWFARIFNESVGRKGRLFHKNFGSAPKWGLKKIHSAIAYLFNNPVEKLLCLRAEEFRWSFLAFLNDTNPFSSKTPFRNASAALKRAKKEVDWFSSSDEPLSYQGLKRWRGSLNDQEWEELVDYIIVRYSPFDYQALVAYYESYENMLLAINSNTGGEYDLREEFNTFSDQAYDEMLEYCRAEIKETCVRRVIMWPEEEKLVLYRQLKMVTSATDRQICKFLHL